jgi:thiamine kinase-like enzyme
MAFTSFCRTIVDDINETGIVSIFDINSLIRSLDAFFVEIIGNRTLFDLSIERDCNISSNMIYFLTINCKDEEPPMRLVFKIRRNITFLNFRDEKYYIRRMEGLIPRQYLYINFDNNIISIEEYISTHNPDENELFEPKNLDLLINGIARLNNIDFFKFRTPLAKPFHPEELLKFKQFAVENFSAITERLSNGVNEAREYYNSVANVILEINQFLNLDFRSEVDRLYKYFEGCYLVFSHVDIHNNNLFINDSGVKFIDYEDLCFHFIGFDLANVIIESIYTFSYPEYPYYIYNHDSELLRIHFLTDCFDKYITRINTVNGGSTFKPLSLQQIYALFCFSILKSVFEYVYMAHDDIYLKQGQDFILLVSDKIKTYRKFDKFLKNNY